MRGFFITFEGIEGVGKTTQIEILAQALRASGHRVATLREPGGTPIGEEIRHTLKHSVANALMAPETELLLMNASRAQLVREVICPALESGQVVICDRYSDSTIAYQGFGRGLDLSNVRTLTEFATGGLAPHLTFLLSLPVDKSAGRVRTRSASQAPVRDRFEEADAGFFERVSAGFQTLAREFPNRIKVIDASQSVQEIHTAIFAVVRPQLPQG